MSGINVNSFFFKWFRFTMCFHKNFHWSIKQRKRKPFFLFRICLSVYPRVNAERIFIILYIGIFINTSWNMVISVKIWTQNTDEFTWRSRSTGMLDRVNRKYLTFRESYAFIFSLKHSYKWETQVWKLWIFHRKVYISACGWCASCQKKLEKFLCNQYQ